MLKPPHELQCRTSELQTIIVPGGCYFFNSHWRAASTLTMYLVALTWQVIVSDSRLSLQSDRTTPYLF